ncbi:hypothetical protein [Sphingomonas sp. BK580]|uniref:hypothetical protein n=1 Tax=Sphingomonas sp. BK580 TaxID=2586972 RepID=UPI00161C94B1|nr:hypothetical protein [Sphingomonas sp. BK580]MBB3693165.1 hypothetical protein [Sphingomonas sp. BK580]
MVEPLSTAEREAMKRNGRGVTDAEIDEYETLIREQQRSRSHFNRLSDHARAAPLRAGRVEELFRKLYGKEPGEAAASGPGS